MTTEPQPIVNVDSDFLLEVFARMAQETGLELSITFNVAGAAVTGELIGRDTWLEELVKATGAADGVGAGDFGTGIQDALHQLDLERSVDEDISYGYVHLRNAFFLAGSRRPIDPPGILWRGRISEISGWGLGAFNG